MIVLGISGFFHHDAAAALLVDGRTAAASEEERFIRQKHAPGCLPLQAARSCLDTAGVLPKDLTALAVSYDPSMVRRLSLRHLLRTRAAPGELRRVTIGLARRTRKIQARVSSFREALGLPPELPVHWVPHHRAHAASAYLFSGFDRAAVLTADGRGELDAGLLARGIDGHLTGDQSLLLPDSLGMFYSSFTQFLGFQPNNDEYKVMGLAAYGDGDRVDVSDFLSFGEGRIRVADRHLGLSDRVNGRVRLFSDALSLRFGDPRQEGGLREPDMHIAAAVQHRLEEAALHWAGHGLDDMLTSSRRLCLAGGVALNVKMNRALLDGLNVDEIYVPPAAHDAGCSLGAAGLVSQLLGTRPRALPHAFLGQAFGEEDMERELSRCALAVTRPPNPADRIAGALARGEVVGLFQGPAEFGPRALGARSILGHPGEPGTADRINREVKFRETWRPFCPSVLRSRIGELTGDDRDAPFMTLGFPVKASWAKRLSEVVHVDGSTRPQTVDPERTPFLSDVIESFHRRSGLPAVLNTSFNRRGEPIVHTPAQALEVFFATGMDRLFLGPFEVGKHRP